MRELDSFNDWAFLASDILMLSAALFLALFMLTYHLRAKWEDNVGGRHIMTFSLALLLVLVLGGGVVLFGADFPGRSYLRFAVYAFLNVVIIQRSAIMFRDQRAAESAVRAPKEQHD